jgi:4-amino-4-deoxy-L-arabinose transferase-like glycosyltransferase
VSLLLLCGGILMGANARCLAIQALDDCFYARKGVEMARRGGFFDVTWNGQPTFQNPPLQIWLCARAFSLFGENDLSARLPSSLLALLTVFLVYRIGRETLGEEAGLGGAALLLICPYFENNARRCMMEMALTFWVTLGVFVFLLGVRKPGILPWIALPLGAALLTKSLLGLVLPFVLLGAAFDGGTRKALTDRRLAVGLLGGLALGLLWPLVEYQRFGAEALRAHFLGEILSRAGAQTSLWAMAADYPYYLGAYFEPALPFGLLGALVLALRGKGPRLLAFWAVAPILLYSLSAARSARYVFPVFPPLALCGGGLLAEYFPGAGLAVRRLLAPLGLLGAAAILWTHPGTLVGQGTLVFKTDRVIRQRVPMEEPLPYFGSRYWLYANPILYYTERVLRPSPPTAREALDWALWSDSRLLLVDREWLRLLPWQEVRYRIVEEEDDWVLVKINRKDDDF